MHEPRFVPLPAWREYPADEMERRATAFRDEMRKRRTVREFSDRPVARSVIERCLEAAGTAPSGANLQPWRFVVVSDPGLKRRVREAAEREERIFYRERAPREWLEALAPLGTDEHKEYLETAPYLIVVFGEIYGVRPDGTHVKHYYVQESVGIATGLLLAALHHAGLCTLTHTPSPMRFLNEVLNRPGRERAFLLCVAGYPAENARVPALTKKGLAEIASFL
jgi:nitroreductase